MTELNTSSQLDALNTNIPAKPLNPVSTVAINTFPTPSAKSSVISPEGIKAITAQIAISSQTASYEDRTKAGVVGSSTGLTAKMLEANGDVFPGAGAHTAALISKGMPTQKALESSVTGQGVSSSKSIISSPAVQAGIVASVVAKSADLLKSSGILSGKENAAESGGPIMAAATMGINKVKSLFSSSGTSATDSLTTSLSSLSTSVSGALGSLKDNLAGGKLAGSLSTSISGAFAGLSTSLSSLGKGGQGLKSPLESAFSAVESSFGSLKSGVKNVLGKVSAGAAATPSPSSAASAAYESAKAEYNTAETAYYEAKRDYRNSSEQTDLDRVNKAEAEMAAAKQKISKASTAFASSAFSAVTGAASTGLASIKSSLTSGLNSLSSSASTTGLSSIKSSLTSGLNALPGGAGAMFAKVTSGATAPSSQSLLSGIGGGDILSKASSLGGDLMKNTTAALKSAVGTAGGTASGLSLDKVNSLAGGAMAQIQSSLGSIPSPSGLLGPILAEGTNLKASITAKMDALKGDSRIPSLTAITSEERAKTAADAEALVAKQKTVTDELETAAAALAAARLNFQTVYSSYGEQPGSESKVATAKTKYEEAQLAMATAQSNYQSTISGRA